MVKPEPNSPLLFIRSKSWKELSGRFYLTRKSDLLGGMVRILVSFHWLTAELSDCRLFIGLSGLVLRPLKIIVLNCLYFPGVTVILGSSFI